MIAYIAHPVAATADVDVATNICRAESWLAWLVEHTDLAICAPWIPYVTAHSNNETPALRQRGMRDDLAVLRRCDLFIAVGARLSAGMAIELIEARTHCLGIIDVTDLELVLPPTRDQPEFAIVVGRIAAVVARSQKWRRE